MGKQVWAHTEGGNMYPRYINIEVDDVTGHITFKIRGGPKDIVGTGYKHVGETGEITLNYMQWLDFVNAISPAFERYLQNLSPTSPEAMEILGRFLEMAREAEEAGQKDEAGLLREIAKIPLENMV